MPFRFKNECNDNKRYVFKYSYKNYSNIYLYSDNRFNVGEEGIKCASFLHQEYILLNVRLEGIWEN